MTPAIATKYPGIAIDLGGQAYIVPAISVGKLQRLHERLKAFDGPLDPASLDVAIDATFAALSRNYPEITRDEVAEMLDLGNVMEVMAAVMDVSGMRRKESEQGKVLAASPSPGTNSSAP